MVSNTWIQEELSASRLTTLVAELYAFQKIEAVISGDSLIGLGPVEILNLLRYQSRLQNFSIGAGDCFRICEAMKAFQFHPCKIDIARLASQWIELQRPESFPEFFMKTLGRRFLTSRPRELPVISICLYGFGRIARILTRILGRYGPGSPIRVHSVLVRKDSAGQISRRAYLLENDSVYGSFGGSVEAEGEDTMIVNGNPVRFIDSGELEEASSFPDRTLFLDTTGQERSSSEIKKWMERKNFSYYATTFPSGDLPCIIHGINQHRLHELAESIFSGGSDAGACVIPLLRLLHDEFEIQDGHIEMVRPYTNDQNLLDNIHRTPRLGRAAPGNLVLSDETLEREIEDTLPELSRRITTGTLRAPVPSGSLAMIHFTPSFKLDRRELNHVLKEQTLRGDLRNQIQYSDSPDLVSGDISGNPHSSVIDSNRTISAGKHCCVYAWYDNEYAYAWQLIRLFQELGSLSVMQYG